MFTFLHAADIHLDSPLRGLDRYEGAPVEEIRNATRIALENLVDLAIEESVAFVVLAGDLYDGDWHHVDTGLFFVNQMSRLRQLGIPVFSVRGNHDAESRISRHVPLPENVHVYRTDRAETTRLEDLHVAIHGQSFDKQCTTADLARNYPAAVSGWFNIGILHTSMTGREGHHSYAPCSEACLRNSGYDYWALGHVHTREVLGGRPTIAFPGNPQGRHIRETGPRGCLLVHVNDAMTVETEFRPLDVLRWEEVEVALDGITECTDALEAVAAKLRDRLNRADGRMLAARVMLTGETPLAREIAADLQHFAAQIRAMAIDRAADELWVEQVKNKTLEPSSMREADDGTPIAEIARLVNALTTTEFEDLEGDLISLMNRLPRTIQDEMPTRDDAWWRETLRAAQAKLSIELRRE